GYITSEDIPAIPSNTSDLTNDSGFITSGDIPPIRTNNNELDNGAGYITSSDVPTNTSDLNNDSGFITSSSLPDVSGVLLIADPTTATAEDVANKINELITALQS